MRTTLAPMLVCPLPSQGMDAETGICDGAKGTELAWAMLVWEDRWSMSSELKNKTQQQLRMYHTTEGAQKPLVLIIQNQSYRLGHYIDAKLVKKKKRNTFLNYVYVSIFHNSIV